MTEETKKGYQVRAKKFYELIKKRESFSEAMELLFDLRMDYFTELLELRDRLTDQQFKICPYTMGDSYTDKTLAYIVWHLSRTEDIVVQQLMAKKEQVFFKGQYQYVVRTLRLTNGSDFDRDDMKVHSNMLDIEKLYVYAQKVYEASNEFLRKLSYNDLMTRMSYSDRRELIMSGMVKETEESEWLADYWCNKDIRSLICRELVNHPLQHIIAAADIAEKLPAYSEN